MGEEKGFSCIKRSDGRYVEEPITGEKPHILKNDLPKVRKINRNVVVGFAGDTLAAVQIINAVDEYQTQYLTLEKVVKILREKAAAVYPISVLLFSFFDDALTAIVGNKEISAVDQQYDDRCRCYGLRQFLRSECFKEL